MLVKRKDWAILRASPAAASTFRWRGSSIERGRNCHLPLEQVLEPA